MQKLLVNHQGNLTLLSTYPKIERKALSTPFGYANEIYTNKVLKPANKSLYGSETYRASLSRAFNHAKQKIYFNPDLKYLVTLTYAQNMQDLDKLYYDIKQYLKNEKRKNKNKEIKYLFTIEKQDRRAYHIHMLTNDFPTTHINKNNYKSVTLWTHGFSSILNSDKADNNFKTYLYMFKYMNKAQRIGHKFVHSSKNLNNFQEYPAEYFDKMLYEKVFTENKQMGYLDSTVKKEYYKRT
jgi:hypothetical protein